MKYINVFIDTEILKNLSNCEWKTNFQWRRFEN